MLCSVISAGYDRLTPGQLFCCLPSALDRHSPQLHAAPRAWPWQQHCLRSGHDRVDHCQQCGQYLSVSVSACGCQAEHLRLEPRSDHQHCISTYHLIRFRCTTSKKSSVLSNVDWQVDTWLHVSFHFKSQLEFDQTPPFQCQRDTGIHSNQQ